MRRSILWGGVGALALAAGAFAYWAPTRETNAQGVYKLSPVERGEIVASVKATGTLTPVSTVLVGSQLSGQVIEILADFNSPVKAGQIVARLDPTQIAARRDSVKADLAQGEADLIVKRARVDRAMATLERARAGINDQLAQRDRAAAQVADAKRTLDRQTELFATGSGAKVTLDQARTQLDVQKAAAASAEAQIASARAELIGLEADVKLAEADIVASEAGIAGKRANLRASEIDLERADIKSPVDGVVVQKSVELGQTVAASLSAPVLFTIAQDLREIEIYVNVDESDVGRIRAGQRATFTVNAYPARTFEGVVKQVRLGAQTIQNVVIYTAVITVRNADLALLPGMTASVSVITEERRNVLKVSNAALRWRPPVAGAPAPAANAPRGGPLALEGAGGANPFAGAGGGGRGEGGGGAQRRAMEEFREAIVAEVKPTSAELVAIDALVAEQRSRFSAALAGSAPGEERRTRMREARQELNQKIREAIAAERRAPYDALIARLAADGPRRGQAGGLLPGRLFKLGDDGQPVAVNVRLGPTDGSVTQIVTTDLAEGAQVIVGGGPKPAPASRGLFGGGGGGGPPRLF